MKRKSVIYLKQSLKRYKRLHCHSWSISWISDE